VATLAAQLAHSPDYPARLAAKARELAAAEKQQPLAAYRAAELAIMKRNFFAPGEPYPQLRRAFVYKHKPTQTPSHLSRQAARFSVIGSETPLDPQSWPFAQIGQSWMVMAVEACSSWPRRAAAIRVTAAIRDQGAARPAADCGVSLLTRRRAKI